MDKQKLLAPQEEADIRRRTRQWESEDIRTGKRQGPLSWMLVDFALSTGLRVGEIAAVTLSDLDLKAGYCTVTRSKKRKKTGRMVTDAATGKEKPEWEPVRKPESLKLDKELVTHLREYLDWRTLTHPDTKSDSLWIGKHGALTAQGLEVLWKRAAILAGLTKTSPKTGKTVAKYSIHAARHTLATALAKKNPKLAQRQCGHSSVSTTLGMYCHVTDDEMADALDEIKRSKAE